MGSFSCSEEISIYADGRIALMISTVPVRNIHCPRLLPLAINFAILKTTQVVAIEAKTRRGTSTVVGSFSDGVVTDSQWKCTSHKDLGWALSGFDDFRWKAAEEISEIGDGGGTDGQIRGILPSAKKIKTNDDAGQIMYCRLHRKIK